MTIKTVKSSGGDYTTVQAAEDACPSDITAGGTNQTWEIECYASASAASSNVLISGITTDATHYVRIYAPVAERHNGTPRLQSEENGVVTMGFSLAGSDYQSAIEVTVAYSKIEGISFRHGGTYPDYAIFATTGVTLCEVDACVYTSAFNYGGYGVYAGTMVLRNCVGEGPTSFLAGSTGAMECYNCTGWADAASNSYLGAFVVSGASASMLLKNCIGVLINPGTSSVAFREDSGGSFHANCTNNVSNDTSAPGSNARTSQTVSFRDTANSDFRLQYTDASSIGYGTPLSFTEDVEGHVRGTSWDVGASQVTSEIDVTGFFNTAYSGLNYVAVSATSCAVGETLLAWVTWRHTTATLSSVSATSESDLTLIGSPVKMSGEDEYCQWAILNSVSNSGTKTITATFSESSVYCGLSVYRLANTDTANPIDGSPVSSTGAAATNNICEVSITTNVAAAIFCGNMAYSDQIQISRGFKRNAAQGHWNFDEIAENLGFPVGTHAVRWITGSEFAYVCHAIAIRPASAAAKNHLARAYGPDGQRPMTTLRM